MARPVQLNLLSLLLSVLSVQLAFGIPLERYERALGSDGIAEKGDVHRQRLAIYNLLESPGYYPYLERQPISRYIPLGLKTRQQVVVPLYKEIPLAPPENPSTSSQEVPPESNRAPYASAQFIQPLNSPHLYPYLPLEMYAPAYPYMYKTTVPEEVP